MTGDARLPDPRRSRAVLVGPAAYEHLSPLPAVPNNVARLRELFADDGLWGLPPENCVTLTDAGSTDEVEEALLAAAREAADTLIFYFAGHGLLDLDSGRLFLALGRAESAPIVRAIDYDRIRRAVRESRCPSKVVILDCCYSGHATMGDFAAQTVVEGTYLLTACGELSLAVAPPGARYTAFTGALVRLLADGIPGGPELLGTEDVYWRLREDLQGAGHPLPVQRSGNRGHRIVLARNRALVPAVDRTASPAVTSSPAVISAPSGDPAAAARIAAAAPTPWLAPAAVLGRVRELREAGGERAADALLDAVGAGRAPQEVVGIVEALDAGGATADADRVLAAAAGRPAAEIAALFGILTRLRRRPVLKRARRAVAAREPVPVAALLTPDQRDPLLDAAVDARFGRPEAMVALIAAISTTRALNGGVLDALLERTAGRIPPADAAALGDVLRDAGREEAAFRVYQPAEEVLAARPAADVVALAVALDEAGHHDQSGRLIARAVAACHDAAGFLALLRAATSQPVTGNAHSRPPAAGNGRSRPPAAGNGRSRPPAAGNGRSRPPAAGNGPSQPPGAGNARSQPPGAVGVIVAGAAATLPADALLGLATDLWRAGRDGEAGDLLATAASVRPVGETIGTLRALADAGRPLDIRRVVEAAAGRGPDEVAELVAHLADTGLDSVEPLLDAVLTDWSKAGQVLVRVDRPETVRYLARRLAQSPPQAILVAMLESVRAGRREGSRMLAELLTRPATLPAADPVERARLAIDVLVGSRQPGMCEVIGRSVHPAELADQLLAEAPGILTTVLGLLHEHRQGRHVDAVLDRMTIRPGDGLGWIRLLASVPPPPAADGSRPPAGAGSRPPAADGVRASAGGGSRPPDLVDAYLRLFLRRHPPAAVAELVRDLNDNGLAPIAGRVIRDVRLDRAGHARRAEVARALAGSPRTAALWNFWSADPTELAAAAAIDELHRRLGERELTGLSLLEIDGWRQELTLGPNEWPLWYLMIPAGMESATIGFSDTGLHVKARPAGYMGAAPEIVIAYVQMFDLRFRAERTVIELRRQPPPGYAGRPQIFHWPVNAAILGRKRVEVLVTLLNQVADAVRQGLAPLSGGRPGPGEPHVRPAAPAP
ncbi:caspase, EACC1-associated type [Actinoplanes sp. CA-030573]|uniref:caspase, EACC1-associated type n=1 Tax=Actinoplanes sp. CA-030573 TaxID=3239898 RepID=UPI003D93C350